MIKIELKNVHHAAFASEETHCFDAVLHVDGKKVAIVSNQGHGGPDRYSWVAPHNWDTLKAINERIVADYPLIDCTDLGMPGHTIEPNLECVVGDLVNAWLVERDLKRSMARKVLFTKLGGSKGTKNVKLLKQWKVSGPKGVQKVYEALLEAGDEGAMLKNPDAPYRAKRTKDMLKLKPVRDVDVRVVRCETGKPGKKHAGRLGTLHCVKKDGTALRVGSGWSDKIRTLLWKHRKDLVGLWLTAIETDPQQKAIKMNHPRFSRWRPDKTKQAWPTWLTNLTGKDV